MTSFSQVLLSWLLKRTGKTNSTHQGIGQGSLGLIKVHLFSLYSFEGAIFYC